VTGATIPDAEWRSAVLDTQRCIDQCRVVVVRVARQLCDGRATLRQLTKELELLDSALLRMRGLERLEEEGHVARGLEHPLDHYPIPSSPAKRPN
jgi:hypothetical protein